MKILISTITMCIFAIIDSGILLFLEEEYDNFLKKFDYLDNFTRPVFLGGTSAAISIFIASAIKKELILPNFKIEETPLIEFIGIILGTIIVIVVYNLFLHHDKEKKIKNLQRLRNRTISYD